MANKLRFMNFGLRLDVAHVFRAAAQALRWDLRGVSPGYDLASTEDKICRDDVAFLVVEPQLGQWLDVNLRLASVCAVPVIALVDHALDTKEREWLRRQGVRCVLRRPLEPEDVRDALLALGLTHAGLRASTDELALAAIIQSVASGEGRVITLSQSQAPLLSSKEWEDRVPSEAYGRVYVADGQLLHAECPGVEGLAALAQLLSAPTSNAVVEPFELEPRSIDALGQVQAALLAASAYRPPVPSLQPAELQLVNDDEYIWARGGARDNEADHAAFALSLAPTGEPDWDESEAATMVPASSGGDELVAPDSRPFTEAAAELAERSRASREGLTTASAEFALEFVESLLPQSDVRATSWQRGVAADERLTPVPPTEQEGGEPVGMLATSAAGIAQVVALNELGGVMAHAGNGDAETARRFAEATHRAIDPLLEMATFLGLGEVKGFGTSPEVGAAAEISGSFVIAARGVRTMDPQRTLAHLRRCRAHLEAGSSLAG